MSPVEFYFAVQDHQERERLSLEINTRTIWETTRIKIWHDYKRDVNIKKNAREKLKLTDIIKFNWEKQREIKPHTIEDMENAMNMIAKRFKIKKTTKNK